MNSDLGPLNDWDQNDPWTAWQEEKGREPAVHTLIIFTVIYILGSHGASTAGLPSQWAGLCHSDQLSIGKSGRDQSEDITEFGKFMVLLGYLTKQKGPKAEASVAPPKAWRFMKPRTLELTAQFIVIRARKKMSSGKLS